MYNIEIIRSKRRTVAVEVKSDLRVLVRAPKRMSDIEISRFVAEKDDWIKAHLLIMEQRIENYRRSPDRG